MANSEAFLDDLCDELLAKAYYRITGKLTRWTFKLVDVNALTGDDLVNTHENFCTVRRSSSAMSPEERRDELRRFQNDLPPFSLNATQREAMKAEMTAPDGNGERCLLCLNTVVPDESLVVYNECGHFLCAGCHTQSHDRFDATVAAAVAATSNSSVPYVPPTSFPCAMCRQGTTKPRGTPPMRFVAVTPPLTIVPMEEPESPVRSPHRSRQRTGDDTVVQDQGPIVTPDVIALQQALQERDQQIYSMRAAGLSIEQAYAQLQASVLQGDGPQEPSSLCDELAYANAVREQALEVKRLKNAEAWQKAEARAINRDIKVAAAVLAQAQSDITEEEVNRRAQELRPVQRRGQQAAPSTSRRVDPQSLEAMLAELDLL